MFLKILPYLGFATINLLYLSCKKRTHIHPMPDKNVVIVFWHGELLMMPKFLQFLHHNYKRLSVIISEHKDGELIAKVAKLCGVETSRGSSSKGAIKALKHMIALAKEGHNLAITPDGPRGPKHEIVADGAIYLAQKLKMPVVCFNYRASKAFRASSWDNFAIPYPFSTLDLYISKPLEIANLDFEDAKHLVHKELLKNAF